MIKKLFTFLFLCILCIGSAWGETKTLIIDGSKLTSDATQGVTEAVYDGVVVAFSDGAKVQSSTGTNKFTDKAILIGKSGKYIYNKTPIPGKITKFEIYANKGASAKVSVGVVFSATAISAYTTGTNTYTATLSTLDKIYDCSSKLPEGAKYFWYQVTNANNSQVQFRITYEEDSTPYITADNVNLAADATSGEINYTLKNASGSTTMTATEKTDVDWISNVTVDAENSKVYFSTTANTAHTTREAIITLTYGTVTRDVKVIQAKYSIYASLVELVEAGTPTSSGDSVTVTLTNEPIIKFYESTSNPGKNKGIYLMAGEKEVEIYCQNVPESWIIGGTVSGTLKKCVWKIYEGTWELCPKNWDELTYNNPTQKTVTFVSLGKTLGTLQTLDYVNLEEAPEATPLTGWTFAGWTAVKTFLMSETAPTFFTNTTLVTEDINLYAVFKKTEGGGGNATASLTNEEICNKLSGSYATGSITNTYGTWNYNACKQGNVSSDGDYFLQIRNNATVSYLQLPNVPGQITSVILNGVCNTSKAQYTGEIYFRTSADNSETPIVTATSSTALENVTLEIPTGYSTGYIMSSGACRIASITVNYSPGITTYSTLAYSRTITADEYGTICLPFASSETSGATFYSIAGKKNEGSSIVLNEVGGNLEAGTPYIFKANGNTITVTFTGEPVAEAKEANGLIGTFVTIDDLQDEWTELDDIYVISGTKFYFVNSAVKCEAYRAFIAMSYVPNATTEAKGDVELFNASALTDINGVNFVVANAGARYNIAGQKVNSSYKGIVIMNGKKYLNK